MAETPKDEDQEKGDNVLRRLLKTPPEPKAGRTKPQKSTERKPSDGDDGS